MNLDDFIGVLTDPMKRVESLTAGTTPECEWDYLIAEEEKKIERLIHGKIGIPRELAPSIVLAAFGVFAFHRYGDAILKKAPDAAKSASDAIKKIADSLPGVPMKIVEAAILLSYAASARHALGAAGDEKNISDVIALAEIRGALSAMFDAHKGKDVAEIIKRELRQFSSKGAAARHANDPKQKAKRHVYDCWKDWQAGIRQYKSKAAFARDMMAKWEVLESQKVITDRWCKDWEQGKNIPTLPAE